MENFRRIMARGSAYGRQALLALAEYGRSALLGAGRLVRKSGAALRSGLERAREALRRAAPGGYLYYRHPLPVRIMHWCNVLLLATLLMSGLNIFNAHPALYWGRQSYDGAPPILEVVGRQSGAGELSGVTRLFGHDFTTTGFLGASVDPSGEMAERGFPSWLTLPDWQWLAMARRWHFFAAWLFVVNGLAFVAFAVASGHLRRDLLPTGRDLRATGKTIVAHLRFRHPRGEAARQYNVLQKGAYLAVIFCLLPLMILMGLGMSPAMDATSPGWVDAFGGRQSVRTIHFVVAWMLVLFVLVHVFMVIVSGFWNNLRSMITGNYRIHPEADHEQ